MTNDDDSASTHATVITDRPERYGKQLASHLGRRGGGEWSAETSTGWIDFGSGRATITAKGDQLQLDITAPCGELSRLEEVVASHLVRFGEQDELSVVWHRDTADTG
jgi:uncharacterized protein